MTIHETLCRAFTGWDYESVRQLIEALDWSGIYPVVDASTRLTGEVADASSADHMVVDCMPRTEADAPTVSYSRQSSDAMILESEFFSELD